MSTTSNQLGARRLRPDTSCQSKTRIKSSGSQNMKRSEPLRALTSLLQLGGHRSKH